MERTAILPFALLFSLFCSSQSGERTLRFVCATEIPGGAYKQLLQTVWDLDERARIAMEDRRVKVGISASVHPSSVLGALNQIGLGQFTFVEGSNSGTVEHSAPSDPPEYRSTGDPHADDATYELAKRAWIAAYPERYDELTRSNSE